jgi:hypothetical protein
MLSGDESARVGPRQAKTEAAITDHSLSPETFAFAEQISLGLLYKLWRQGKGPAYFYVGRSRRISHEARQEWRRQLEAEAARRPAGEWLSTKRRAPQPNRLNDLARPVVLATTAKLNPNPASGAPFRYGA